MKENIITPAYTEVDIDCYEDQIPQGDDLEPLRVWLLKRDHLCVVSTEQLLKEAQNWPKPRAEQELEQSRAQQAAEAARLLKLKQSSVFL